MQSTKLMLVHAALAVRSTFDALREPLAELVVRVEERRHDKVEESPELVHRVLDRRAGEEQSVAAAEAEERLPPRRAGRLDRLRLVEDHVLPLDLVEVLFVGDSLYAKGTLNQPSALEVRMGKRAHELVRGDDDVERRVAVVSDRLAVPELAEDLAVFDRSPVRESFQIRHELCNLLHPVVQRRSGRDDEERSPDVVDLGEVGHERDRLDRLAQTHLVCEDAVDALLVEVGEPVETLELVLLERAGEHLWLRDDDLFAAEFGILEVELGTVEVERSVRARARCRWGRTSSAIRRGVCLLGRRVESRSGVPGRIDRGLSVALRMAGRILFVVYRDEDGRQSARGAAEAEADSSVTFVKVEITQILFCVVGVHRREQRSARLRPLRRLGFRRRVGRVFGFARCEGGEESGSGEGPVTQRPHKNVLLILLPTK